MSSSFLTNCKSAIGSPKSSVVMFGAGSIINFVNSLYLSSGPRYFCQILFGFPSIRALAAR
ncbi:MAG: hypothetical protein R6W84_12480 [Promethearchaeia archaeon]